MFAHHGKFGRGSGSEADVDHVKAHAHEGADDGVEHHAARETRIASDDDDIGLHGRIATHEGGISRGKLDDIEGR